MAWTPPPNWPAPPNPGWSPPDGWTPDPSWGPPPPGWNFWPVTATPMATGYGNVKTNTAGNRLREWVEGHKALAAVAGVVIVVIVIIAAASGGGGSKKKPSSVAAVTVTSTPDPSSSTPDAVPSSPAPIIASPDPKAKYTSSCDYLLGDFTQSSQGYRFVARATMHNAGNVGVVAGVKASWVQVGAHNVVRSKTVHIPWHGSRAVNFSVVVSQSQIDAIQSGQDAGSICHVKAIVLDSYGVAHN